MANGSIDGLNIRAGSGNFKRREYTNPIQTKGRSFEGTEATGLHSRGSTTTPWKILLARTQTHLLVKKVSWVRQQTGIGLASTHWRSDGVNGRRRLEGTSAHARDVAIAAAHVGTGQAQGARNGAIGYGEDLKKATFMECCP